MTKQETILKYISDMAALENQAVQTLKNQEADSDLTKFPTVLAFIRKIKVTSEIHLSGLESIGRSLNGETRSTFKEAVTAVSGAAMGALSHLRTHNVSKMLRDDHATLSLLAIGYTMLHTTGLALNSAEAAEIAQEYLKDTAALIMELSHISIPVVIEELAESNIVSKDIESVAQKNLNAAWRE